QAGEQCLCHAGRQEKSFSDEGLLKIAVIGNLTRPTIFRPAVTKTVSFRRASRPGEPGSRLERTAL
ncbi:hypothetical protein, partial [Nevskia sp.]|uniref:hypothetical protein n=1 Tax=Nevskia sp. TaxID=1929292 RepID=UPI0025ECE382